MTYSHPTRSHFVPSSEEARELRSLVQRDEQEIGQLDDQWQQLHKELMELRSRRVVGRRPVSAAQAIARVERRRKALILQVSTYRALLAPLRKLPAELLEYVFTWCHEHALAAADADHTAWRPLAVVRVPLQISQV
jgi:hypothetical protein